ncbi:MAG: HAD-IA family hydrolase [Clostridiales bacterium]|nr:HAD-IA family hydrolase [Clostridiales bacterium]
MAAALFDLDGVIIDSESTYTKFWATTGREYGCDEEFAHKIKGTTLKHILTLFDSQKVRDEISQKIDTFEQTMEYPFFPGVLEFLSKLRERGIKIALFTSSDDKKMSYLYRQHPQLREMFDAEVTGSMVTHSKPDPEGYLMAARLLGCDIRDCYVFEDSFQGLEAGMRSGAIVIGLATTNTAASLKGKAHKVIENFVGFSVDDMLSVSRP